MDYFKNHCWCSSSNWGGNYDCSIIVNLNCYEENYKEDWKNLIVQVPTKKKVKWPNMPEIEIDTTYITLKPEVIDWLHNNVNDFKGDKGWCIGSKDYDSNCSSSYSVFFQRRRDALKFIKVWSKWKKPLYYTQYFTDIRKELDITTGKYKIRN